MMINKNRLDILLVRKGLVKSREKAKDLIRRGKILVNGEVIRKPSKEVSVYSSIELIEGFKFVSRGGYKLEFALNQLNVDVRDKVCLDIGASEGGFTDCLLQYGARKVYAVDIARDFLNENLLASKRVVKICADARERLPINETINVCVIDATFLRLDEVIIANLELVKNGVILGLVKPPYIVKELRRVYSKEEINKVLQDTLLTLKDLGLVIKGVVRSPIVGKIGKQEEFFVYASFRQ